MFLRLLFLIAIFSFSCKSQKQETKFIEKEFPNYNVSISIPENWELSSNDLSKMNVIYSINYKSPSNKSIYQSVFLSLSYIDYFELEKNISEIEYIKKLKNDVKSKFPNTKIKEIKIPEYQNINYYASEYNLTTNNLTFTYFNFIFIKSGIIFNNVAIVKTDEIDDYETQIIKVFRSLKVGKITEIYKKNKVIKSNTGKYYNKELGISFVFPENMNYAIVNNRLNIKKTKADKNEFFNVLVDVVHHKQKLNRTSKINMEVIIDVFKDLKQIPRDEKININRFDHDLYDAYQIEFDSNLGEKELSVFVYSYFVNNTGYQVTGITDKKHRIENKKIFDEIFKSLKIEE